MLDSGDTHNIMPLSIMKTIGVYCTKNYKAGEFIFVIDSRSVSTYKEIKYFCARIISFAHIHIVFTIIVVDLPLAYSLIIGQEWIYPLGGDLMNDGSCMMLPNKDGRFTKVPCEENNPICYQRKEDQGMDNFSYMGLGNYVILKDITNEKSIDQIIDGLWKLYFNGACSKNGSGIEVVVESPHSKIYPHSFKLQFE